jgi:hypothetical protein
MLRQHLVGSAVWKTALPVPLVLLYVALSLAIVPVRPQEVTRYLARIEQGDAKVDKELPDSLRSAFEDSDDSPLKSVSFDLNGDGVKEKFIPNELLGGSGGCPWIIYDPKRQRIIGKIGAKVIFIQEQKSASYAVLECYWRNGGGEGSVFIYEFKGEDYQTTDKFDLHNEEIEDYFAQRRDVPHVTSSPD